MSRHLVDLVAPPVYALVDFAVIVAPAAAVVLAANRGGMGDGAGVDLLVASSVLGAVHAVVAFTRLRIEEVIAVRRGDIWIAAVDALVVLALAATLLLVVLLHSFADEHASLADRGYPVVVMWASTQLFAILLAELTGRFVFWWLEPHDPHTFGRRRTRPVGGARPVLARGSLRRAVRRAGPPTAAPSTPRSRLPHRTQPRLPRGHRPRLGLPRRDR